MNFRILQYTFKPALTVLLLFGFLLSSGKAQSWDYEKYPPLPISISHLDAELRILEVGEIEGDLLYTIQFRDNNVDSLVFDAPGMEISQTVVADNSQEYYTEDNQLIISIDEYYERGDEVTLRIQYRTAPDFGLHQTQYGTFFTSFLPKAASHWLPVIDHPRIEFTSDFVITHPAGQSIIANGRRGETVVESVDYEVTTFTSNKVITPGGISFVMGNINQIASTVDTNVSELVTAGVDSFFQRRTDSQIYIYSETEETNPDSLLSVSTQAFSEVSEATGLNYPYRDLHIVVVEDDYWETKSYGSGLFYVFKNKGSIEQQIQVGILSQWIGAHTREEQWEDSHAINLLKAFYANRLFDLDYTLEESSEPYHFFSSHQLSKWQYFLDNEDNDHILRNVEWITEEMFSEKSLILGWQELSNLIYNHSGQSYFDGFQPEEIIVEEPVEYEYTATLERNEEENEIEIEFQAIGNSIDELVNVVVTEVNYSDQEENELTFTGANDSIVMSVSGNMENIKLSTPDRSDLTLIEKKPFQFWIFQLQNDDDPERRRQAAAALSEFTDNPDLQLALTDLFNVEENPGVYAEILRSLSAITSGASGTEQTFIRRLSNEQPKKVQLAAIEGLAYFKGNDQVISRLRSIINNSDDAEMRRTAIRSLYEVTEPDAFLNITESLITQESALHEVPMLLTLLAQHGEAEAAVRFSSTFLAEGFPYDVRKQVLDLVLEYDNSESGWEARLPDLLADRDPRIRFHSILALQRVSSQARESMVNTRLPEEFDERVREELVNMQ